MGKQGEEGELGIPQGLKEHREKRANKEFKELMEQEVNVKE